MVSVIPDIIMIDFSPISSYAGDVFLTNVQTLETVLLQVNEGYYIKSKRICKNIAHLPISYELYVRKKQNVVKLPS